MIMIMMRRKLAVKTILKNIRAWNRPEEEEDDHDDEKNAESEDGCKKMRARDRPD